MILVADASFAAKLVLAERGTEIVQQWWADDAVTWSSPALVAAEVEAAIHVHHRRAPAAFDEGQRRAASTAWQQALAAMAVHVIDEHLVAGAVRAISTYGPLRGADACYVALAWELADAVPADTVVLGTFDHQQRTAATNAGLVLAPGTA